MTQEVVQRWADMNGIPFIEAAKEIKYLLDLGTVAKEKRPFAEGRTQNNLSPSYREAG